MFSFNRIQQLEKLDAVTSLFGGAPKAKAAAPITARKPIAAADDGAAQAKKVARATLYETTGGASGQELQPDQVKKRDTLLGN